MPPPFEVIMGIERLEFHRVDSNILAFRSEPFTSLARLREFRAHISAATQNSEDLTVTIESVFGVEYDTVIYRLDLSTASTVDITDNGFSQLIVKGDRLLVDYANTGGLTIGWQLILIPEA